MGGDPESILRKEVLIYAAFLPLILVAGRGQGQKGLWALAACIALFALAAAGHEMSLFYVPALTVAILACRPRDAASWAAVAAVAALGFATFGFALRHPMVADIGAVCDPLTARGLAPRICDGAIAWLGHDFAFVQEQLRLQAGDPWAWTLALAYGAVLFPFVVALWKRPDAGRRLWAILLTGLPFVPLWFVAVDWGRWVNAHVAVMVFLVLILIRTGRLPGFGDPLPRLLFLVTLAVCLGLGMRHVGATIRPGLIFVPLRTFVLPGL